MMRIFGYAIGTARALVRYSDNGEIRIYINNRPEPEGPAEELKGSGLITAMDAISPLGADMPLETNQVRAIHYAIEALIKDLTTPKGRKK